MRSAFGALDRLAGAICAGLICGLMCSPARAQSIQIQVPIAYLYDLKSGAVLYDRAADRPHPPASLIKLVTAETVFDALKRGEMTPETEQVITESIWRRGGAPSRGPTMFATVNSRIAVRDLLQALVVQSANDAALALAEALSRTEADFVGRMQARARAIGMNRTVIRNATGFAHDQQVTTARDLALVAAYILREYSESARLFAQREFTWNGIRQTSRNPLLGMNIGADGMLTGNLTDSGFGLVGTAVQEDRRLIVVILGADSAERRSSEARRLLEWGFRNFEHRTLFEAMVPLAEARVIGGTRSTVPIGLAAPLETLLPRSAQDVVSVRVRYEGPLRAPVRVGQPIGRLSVLHGQTVVSEAQVLSLEEVTQGTLRQRAFDNVAGWVGSFLPKRSPRS